MGPVTTRSWIWATRMILVLIFVPYGVVKVLPIPVIHEMMVCIECQIIENYYIQFWSLDVTFSSQIEDYKLFTACPPFHYFMSPTFMRYQVAVTELLYCVVLLFLPRLRVMAGYVMLALLMISVYNILMLDLTPYRLLELALLAFLLLLVFINVKRPKSDEKTC